MRVGIVRTDLGNGIYFADLDNKTHRPFASSPPGQDLTVRRPTDAEWEILLGETIPMPVLEVGTDTNATVDTSANDTLRIRRYPGSAYTVIAVTSGVATAKTVIRDDLNTAFLAAGIPFLAAVVGTNQLRIVTVAPNMGPGAILDLDTFANGSTLNTPAGFTDGVTQTGLSLAAQIAAFQAAVYPTTTTIDVSGGTILGVGSAVGLHVFVQLLLVNVVANMVAPQLVGTPSAIRSFSIGAISKARAATFQPQGYPAGVGVAVVENDGVTPMTLSGV